MIVEIFGHAGAGKTTLAQILEYYLSRRGVGVVVVEARGGMTGGRIARRLLQCYGLIRCPRITILGIKLLRASGVGDWRALGTLGGLAYRKIRVDKYAKDSRIVLIDEGVLHAMWSLTLLASVPNTDVLGTFIRKVINANYLLSIRPDRNTVMSRLATKEEHRLHSRSVLELRDVMDKQEALLDSFEEHGRLHSTVVRVGDSETARVQQLALQLEEVWRGLPENKDDLGSDEVACDSEKDHSAAQINLT